MTRPTISVVTPAFNEAANLPALFVRLVETLEAADLTWEWIVVDDHSRDDTFATIQHLAQVDPRVRGCRLARNGGSHVAVACGLRKARGASAVVLVADGQDPPEIIRPSSLPGVAARMWSGPGGPSNPRDGRRGSTTA